MDGRFDRVDVVPPVVEGDDVLSSRKRGLLDIMSLYEDPSIRKRERGCNMAASSCHCSKKE